MRHFLSNLLRNDWFRAAVKVPGLALFVLAIGLIHLLCGGQGEHMVLLLLADVLVIPLLWAVHLLLREWKQCRDRRKHYQSGDRERVQTAVLEELDLGRAPLRLGALAWAGVGEFARARRALLSAQEADPEDHELRLCTQIVMCSFEGEGADALRLCRRLLGIPVSGSGGSVSRRLARREGIVALARAVCGAADEGDYLALSRASSAEPTLYWVCRYGAAVACCVKNEEDIASQLVKNAPTWPRDSAFRRIHSRILAATRLPKSSSLEAV